VTTRPGGPASRAQFIRATLVPDALRAVPELMPGIPVSSAGPGPATRSHGLPLNRDLTPTDSDPGEPLAPRARPAARPAPGDSEPQWQWLAGQDCRIARTLSSDAERGLQCHAATVDFKHRKRDRGPKPLANSCAKTKWGNVYTSRTWLPNMAIAGSI
jgi:hypothetical protein